MHFNDQTQTAQNRRIYRRRQVKAFFVTATSVLALLATTAVAQADDAALRKQLQDLAAKFDTLQTEVSSLKAQNKELQVQQKAQQTEIGTKAPAPPPGTVSPVSLNPADIVTKGEVPGSIKLPGTDTSIKFGGYIKLDVINDIKGGGFGAGGTNAAFGAIPLRGSAQSNREGNWWLTGRESRLSVETFTPTEIGKLHTLIEGDFYGTGNAGGNESTNNGASFRFRYAYADLGNFTLGQARSTFQEVRTLAESLDFGGPLGHNGGLRQGLLRYTEKLGASEVAVAIENPETEFLGNGGSSAVHENFTSGGAIPPGNFVDKAPDLVARYTYGGAWGTATLAGVLRYLTIDNNGGTAVPSGGVNRTAFIGDDSTLAGGLGFGLSINTIGKDRVLLNGTAGPGLGRYTAGVGGTNNAAYVKNGELKPLFSYGAQAAYQHFWTDTLRSNLIYGRVENDNKRPYVPATAADLVQSVHANLLWSPIPKSRIGVEYIYGTVENGTVSTPALSNKGEAHRVQFSAQYGF
jgi:Porin subfamily